jgi:hypothetical protein
MGITWPMHVPLDELEMAMSGRRTTVINICDKLRAASYQTRFEGPQIHTNYLRLGSVHHRFMD